MHSTANVHIASNVPLPSPRALVAELPPAEAQADFVSAARQEIRDILFGRDPRFLVIVGPCSIHDPEAGLEYAARLVPLRRAVRDPGADPAAWRQSDWVRRLIHEPGLVFPPVLLP